MSYHRVRVGAAVFIVWLAGAALLFREQWRSGFNILMGNDGDTRLETYICEHWFRVFHGQASWLNPQFYYPVRGLLGWSDTFFVYEIFYAPLRLMGCDPFLALQITGILLSLVGFSSIVFLVRSVFKAPLPLALAAGLAVTFSNALWLHPGAYQHDGVYVVALVASLAWSAWRAAESGRFRRSLLLAVSAGLLGALLLYSAYYVSYFSLLAFLVYLLVSVLSGPRHAVAWVRAVAPRRWPLVATAAVGFVVGLSPFALTYLPARPDEPRLTYAQVMGYAGRLPDLVDVGPGNVWSPVVHAIFPSINFRMDELTYSVTPVLMIAALAGGALCGWWVVRKAAIRRSTARAAATLALTAAILELLPLRTRLGTAWAVMYHLPGANAMRAIDRIDLVAGVTAVLALVAAAVEVWEHTRTLNGKRQLYARGAVAIILAAAVAEQYNSTPTSAVNRDDQLKLLAAATAPPAGCRSFYVVDSRSPDLSFFESQIDAMLVSQKLRVPTINGYTAYNPIGWNLSAIGSPGYADDISSWVQLKGVQNGLCQLDLGTMRWSRPSGLG